MPRKSSASLSVVQIGVMERVRAPDDLTPSQMAVWEAAVNSKPVEWFGEDSIPLLVEYVRAVAMADVLDEYVRKALDTGHDDYMSKLLVSRDRESKRVAMLGTKLRLTQQSRYMPRAAATADRKVASGGKPWQSAR